MSDQDVERGYGFAMGVMKALFMVFIVFPVAVGIIIAIIVAVLE